MECCTTPNHPIRGILSIQGWTSIVLSKARHIRTRSHADWSMVRVSTPPHQTIPDSNQHKNERELRRKRERRKEREREASGDVDSGHRRATKALVGLLRPSRLRGPPQESLEREIGGARETEGEKGSGEAIGWPPCPPSVSFPPPISL